jgi:hypothetical protein
MADPIVTQATVTPKTAPVIQKRIRCPKGMKLSKVYKTYAALGPFKTKAERNEYMRMMGTAVHEAALKVKQAAKQADRSSKHQAPVIGSARTTIEGASVAEPTEE